MEQKQSKMRMSVCLSVCPPLWFISKPTQRISVRFGIEALRRKLKGTFTADLLSTHYNLYFTRSSNTTYRDDLLFMQL
jgi:hypothetical protein